MVEQATAAHSAAPAVPAQAVLAAAEQTVGEMLPHPVHM
jgi:hypothetical protein